MKKALMILILFPAFSFLGGCCSDQMACGSTYVATTSCCSTCNSCGYSYNAGWY